LQEGLIDSLPPSYVFDAEQLLKKQGSCRGCGRDRTASVLRI